MSPPDLASALADRWPDLAEAVRVPGRTRLSRRPIPGAAPFDAYVVSAVTGRHPRIAVVAAADDGRSMPLDADPRSLTALARLAGVRLSSAQDALAWARLLFELRRLSPGLHVLVEHADEIPWLPQLDPDDEHLRSQTLARVATDVEPPTAEPMTDGKGWIVHAWTVDGADLNRLQIGVTVSGEISVREESVARDLPVVYGA